MVRAVRSGSADVLIHIVGTIPPLHRSSKISYSFETGQRGLPVDEREVGDSRGGWFSGDDGRRVCSI